MNTLNRYQSLRQTLNRLPADYYGQKMNLQHMDVPEENGVISRGSRIDEDPASVDIIHLSRDGYKGNYTAETFIETPPKRTWWGRKKADQQLVHLTRKVSHTGGGYGLADVVLSTMDLKTGEMVSQVKGDKAVRAAQKLEDEIPFRIHTIDPVGLERQEENLLS